MEKTSRFNYIKRGLVGVCAATMLTGLCAAPAFAASEVSESRPVDTGTGVASTEVTALTEVGNISATVPTKVVLSVAPSGELTFPTNDFKIHINEGNWPMKVSKLVVAPESAFTLATTDEFTEANSNLYLTLNGTALAADSSENTDAVAALAQNESKVEDLSLAMTGKTKGLAYSTTSAKLVTLTWTIAPVTA